MSFPHDDAAWAETAAFLRAKLAPADRMVAPDPFRWAIPRAERFDGIGALLPADFAWVVVHKGELERIPRHFLDALAAQSVPVFANAVFVVFAGDSDLPDVRDTDHLRAFEVNHRALPPEPMPLAEPEAPPEAAPMPIARPAPAPARQPRAVRRPPRRAEVPPRPWLLPGGTPGPARENAYQAELDRLVVEYLRGAEGEAVLDIGCGAGRLGPLLPAAGLVTGIDVSPAAIEAAQARHAWQPAFGFLRMDAARLAFPDASFDTALLIDTLETLADVPAVLAEAARVLAQGGRLMLSATNRDSLVLRAQRRLGPAAKAGFTAAEAAFTVTEVTGMLRAAGLSVVRSDGCFLSPGWGLPGAAPGLVALEEDPEFIEAARLLGRRAGPDHALGFVVLARKA
jgi:SAM-dependent methyltransferase